MAATSGSAIPTTLWEKLPFSSLSEKATSSEMSLGLPPSACVYLWNQGNQGHGMNPVFSLGGNSLLPFNPTDFSISRVSSEHIPSYSPEERVYSQAGWIVLTPKQHQWFFVCVVKSQLQLCQYLALS